MNKTIFTILPLAFVATAALTGCNSNEVKVTFNGNDNIVFEGSSTAKKGQDYTAKITAKDKTVLIRDNFEVKVSNTLSDNWSFNTNKLIVNASAVTGDLVITYKEAKQDITFTSKCKNLKVEVTTPLMKQSPFQAKITPKNTGSTYYRAPDVITLTIDDVTKTVGTDYTYNVDTGEVYIPRNNVTGDIKITAEGTEVYKVTFTKYGYGTKTSPYDDKVLISYGDKTPIDVDTFVDIPNKEGYKENKSTYKYAYDCLYKKYSSPRAYDKKEYTYDTTLYESKNLYKYLDEDKNEIVFGDKPTSNVELALACKLDTFTLKSPSTDVEITKQTSNEDITFTYGETATLNLSIKDGAEEGTALPFASDINIKVERYGQEVKSYHPTDEEYIVEGVDRKSGTLTLKDIQGNVTVNLYPKQQFSANFYNPDGSKIITVDHINPGTTLVQAYANEPEAKDTQRFVHWKVFESGGKVMDGNDLLDGAVTKATGEHNYIAVYDTVNFENDTWTNFNNYLAEDYNAQVSGATPGTTFTDHYKPGSTIGISEFLECERKIIIGTGLDAWQYTIRVIDVTRDLLMNSSTNTALFTFEFDEFINKSIAREIVSKPEEQKYYYNNSSLKSSTDALYDKMPDSIKDNIKEVDKSCRTNLDVFAKFNAKIFPLSAAEYGLDDSYLRKEGTGLQQNETYYYYASGKHKPSKHSTSWTRTQYGKDADELADNKFYAVDTNGNLVATKMDQSLGIAPGFCM